MTSRRLLRSVLNIGVAVIGPLLLVALGTILFAAGTMWAQLYNDPCLGYSWDRENGQFLGTTFEPGTCYKGGPRQTFSGKLLIGGWRPYFSPDPDAAIDDRSWVPVQLPIVFGHYLLDHVATPDRNGRAVLRVQFVGSRLERYPTPFFRVATLDGPGDTVIYIERLTRVERDMGIPSRPANKPTVR